MTDEQLFVHVCDELGLAPDTRTLLRRVLLHGEPPAEVAPKFGIQQASAEKALYRYRLRVQQSAAVPPPAPEPEPEDDEAPIASLTIRRQALHLWLALQGPERSQPPPPLVPVDGDRDRVTARAVTVEDVEDVLWQAAARREKNV